MIGYVAGRLLRASVTVVAVSLVAFALTRASGDPAAVLIPPEASTEQRALLRQELGLDQPLPLQYLRFAGDAVRGDFGTSLRFNESASDLFWTRFPSTAQLAALASVFALVGGSFVGIVSGVWASSSLGRFLTASVYIAQSIPSFVLAILMMTVFSAELGWLPSSGKSGPASFVMPALSLSLFSFAVLARLARVAIIDALRSDFVRTARMKGLGQGQIVLRHIVPNLAVSILSVFALHVVYFLGGSVIVETIFAWPGIGQLAVQSVLARDYVVAQAIVFYVSVFAVMLTVLLETVSIAIDPRMRRG